MSGDGSAESSAVAPMCNCSLSWRYRKGNGPDPARCPVHGDLRTPPGSVTA